MRTSIALVAVAISLATLSAAPADKITKESITSDGQARTYHLFDPRRIYVFGHSGGAVFALYMGLLESRYFAAVAISAGAFRNPAEFTSIDLAKRKIPFAVFVGTDDPLFPPSAVHATRDAFVAAGLPFDLTEIKGHDHNYYVRADDINRQAWKFLAAQSLSEDPKFDQHQLR